MTYISIVGAVLCAITSVLRFKNGSTDDALGFAIAAIWALSYAIEVAA